MNIRPEERFIGTHLNAKIKLIQWYFWRVSKAIRSYQIQRWTHSQKKSSTCISQSRSKNIWFCLTWKIRCYSYWPSLERIWRKSSRASNLFLAARKICFMGFKWNCWTSIRRYLRKTKLFILMGWFWSFRLSNKYLKECKLKKCFREENYSKNGDIKDVKILFGLKQIRTNKKNILIYLTLIY